MATASTLTAPLLFVTRRPAWEMPVELEQAHVSGLFTGRSGFEQRQGRRLFARWKLTYSTATAATAAEIAAERAVAELAAPLAVPFWTEGAKTASTVGSSVLMNRRATIDFFRAGDFVYFWDGTVGQFRVIDHVDASNDQRLHLEADGDAIAFPSGTWIFPVRLAVRNGRAEFDHGGREAIAEKLEFVTL